jgi:hypothetical protein
LPISASVNFHVSPTCNKKNLLQKARFLFIEILFSQKFHNKLFALLPDMHCNCIYKSHLLELTKSFKKGLVRAELLYQSDLVSLWVKRKLMVMIGVQIAMGNKIGLLLHLPFNMGTL